MDGSVLAQDVDSLTGKIVGWVDEDDTRTVREQHPRLVITDDDLPPSLHQIVQARHAFAHLSVARIASRLCIRVPRRETRASVPSPPAASRCRHYVGRGRSTSGWLRLITRALLPPTLHVSRPTARHALCRRVGWAGHSELPMRVIPPEEGRYHGGPGGQKT
jgi:hypothetical protein